MELSNRGFDLQARLAAINAEPVEAERRRLLQELRAEVARDQKEIRDLVEWAGGRLRTHLWAVNACTVEIPPANLPLLRAHPRSKKLWPDDARTPGEVPAAGPPRPPAPIGTSTNAFNHNTGAAHAILGHKGDASDPGIGGTRARIAFFDTGLDLDQGNGEPHDAFYGEGGARDGPGIHGSRLLGSFLVTHPDEGGIDCNDDAVQPYCHPALPDFPPPVRHGTGVAGIAAGEDTGWIADEVLGTTSAGQAPQAEIVGWSISIHLPGAMPAHVWVASVESILNALQQLREWVLETQQQIHVLNYSWDGWSEPDHPTQVGFDLLERDLDILVVAAAANRWGDTRASSSFVNGLAVGSVHARDAENAPYWPMAGSSLGPMVGDPGRFFPDLCATGAVDMTYPYPWSQPPHWPPHVEMPLVDHRVVPPPCQGQEPVPGVYTAHGTSMAAPQVSGIAALYRAHRPQASAQETRAALLLGVDDPLPLLPEDQHTYRSRNTYGAGYVRADFVAEYATRPAGSLGTEVTLTPAVPDQNVQYLGLVPNELYAVAIAWPRLGYDPDTEVPWEWADVALEVWDGSNRIAVSETPRNTYERLVFRAPGSSVTLRVLGRELHSQSVPVYVAARRVTVLPSSGLQAGSGTVVGIPQESGCQQPAHNQRITRVVPNVYEQQWGSWPFLSVVTGWYPHNPPNPPGAANLPYQGALLHANYGDMQTAVWNTIIHKDQVGGAFTATGVGLRILAPFPGFDPGGGNLQVLRLHLRNEDADPGAVQDPWWWDPGAGNSHASGYLGTFKKPVWSPRTWDSWGLIIPFDAGKTFEYRYDQGKHLGIWFEMAIRTSGPWFAVDAAHDPSSGAGLYATHHGKDPAKSENRLMLGRTLVWGIIEEDGGLAPRTPRLTLHGEPSVGHKYLLMLTDAPPNSLFILETGTETDVLQTPCRIFVQNPIQGFTQTAWTDPMGHALFIHHAVPPSTALFGTLVHQALAAPGLPWVASNAIRVTYGGKH